jgi:Uncharacterised nucleotidyltransferase
MVVPRSRARKTVRPARPRRSAAEERIELTLSRPPLSVRWASAISREEWNIYRDAIQAMKKAGIRFMLGGGFALAAYTGRWRDTKDIDFYIMPQDRDRTVRVLTEAGLSDYFSRLRYDRKWIYRSVRSGVIVDVIWAMANQRAQVDELWFERGQDFALRSQQLRIIPAEEFIWCKLYIMQRDHCDWTDVFNVLYCHGDQMDWKHLIKRLEEDTPLLRGMLHVYSWLCPEPAKHLPDWLWTRLDMPAPRVRPARHGRDRVRLLDSRNWFAGRLEPGAKLEV